MTKPLLLAVTLAYGLSGASAAGVLEAELKPEAAAAFDRYVQLVESQMDAEVRRADGFLSVDRLGGSKRGSIEAAVRRGGVVSEPQTMRENGRDIAVPGARVHHWIGLAFMPRVRLGDAVALLQDYDRHARIYSPAVQRSKVLERDGDRFRVFLRFRQKRIITVTINSEHRAEFVSAGGDRAYSKIRSTRVAEVADEGTAGEHEKPVGRDGGYLWRINSYWRLLERDGGTYIQCESVTLTRDIPFGAGWLVGPFVTSIPRDSLTFTMEQTRKALTSNISFGDPRLQLRDVDGERAFHTRADEVAGAELAVSEDALDLRLGLVAARALMGSWNRGKLLVRHDRPPAIREVVQ